jgi:hypothetical protein
MGAKIIIVFISNILNYISYKLKYKQLETQGWSTDTSRHMESTNDNSGNYFY